MLFARLWLFGFYSPLLAHTHALTWCTCDNPVCAALETLRELHHTVRLGNDIHYPTTSGTPLCIA